MSSESTKPLVLVVGATGRTVQGVLDALVDAGTFVGFFPFTVLL
jgi:hypothetical protein